MKTRLNQLQFKNYEPWQSQLFALALLHRMLPNYQYFSKAVGFGDPQVLANQLDIIGQKLAGMPIKLNAESQLEKLYPNVPKPQNYDFYAVFPALDFCTGLECLWHSFIDKSIYCADELSQLSKSCVEGYIEFIDEQGGESGAALLEWELATQQDLFDLIKEAKPNKSNYQAVKAMAIGERVSSLGIEY